jgi:hypothetical protein
MKATLLLMLLLLMRMLLLLTATVMVTAVVALRRQAARCTKRTKRSCLHSLRVGWIRQWMETSLEWKQ